MTEPLVGHSIQFAAQFLVQYEYVNPLQHIHLTRLDADEARRFLNDEFGLDVELGVIGADLCGNRITSFHG